MVNPLWQPRLRLHSNMALGLYAIVQTRPVMVGQLSLGFGY